MLVLKRRTMFQTSKMFSLDRLTFSSEIKQVREEINMSVATSTGELILYFKQILKTWVGKLSRDSVARAYFTGLRRSSKLRRAQLKLFSLGRTFRLSRASQPIASVSINESWKFEYYSWISYDKMIIFHS